MRYPRPRLVAPLLGLALGAALLALALGPLAPAALALGALSGALEAGLVQGFTTPLTTPSQGYALGDSAMVLTGIQAVPLVNSPHQPDRRPSHHHHTLKHGIGRGG